MIQECRKQAKMIIVHLYTIPNPSLRLMVTQVTSVMVSWILPTNASRVSEYIIFIKKSIGVFILA